jgi:exopolysaccharide biosynthesis polyprenyl glycosylphosphotransferase
MHTFMESALPRGATLPPPSATAAGHGRRLALRLLGAAFVGDFAVVLISLAASGWLRFESALADWGVGARTLHWDSYAGHMLIGAALFSALALHFHVYTLPVTLRFRRLSAALLQSAVAWLFACIALAYLLRSDQPLSRLYLGLAFPVTVTALHLWRLAYHRVAVRAAVAGKLRQRILFVDWSTQAAALTETLIRDQQHVYEIVGSVAPAREAYSLPPPARVRRLGYGEDLPALLHRHAIDLVVLAGLEPSSDDMVRLANLCEKELVEFKIITGCFPILASGLHLETVGGVPVLGLSRLPLLNPFNLALKRAVDIAGGLVGLALSAPLIAVFGLLVYRESPGPVFYRQLRLGHAGRPFWIYKLRSMRPDAEADGRAGWSTRDDPRRLRIGAFMRRWNIDETPQFWNVLKGEMSLVGPRPERPELIVGFKESIPHYNARHHIKPGITGWAQVHGFRGDTDLHGRIRCDLYYIENWSPFLDLQIMLLTLFRHKNAC